MLRTDSVGHATWLKICALMCLFFFLFFLVLPPLVYADHCSAGMVHDPTDATKCVIADNKGNPIINPNDNRTLSNDGILGCRGLGAQVANVGTLSAIGGIYVPVNDAAVTLNTGFLVYKECILDGVTRKIAENISAEYTSQQLRAFNEGRGGNAQYLVNFPADFRPRRQAIVLERAQGEYIAPICEAFRNSVRRVAVREYLASENNVRRAFTCSLPRSTNERTAFFNSQPLPDGVWYDMWFSAIQPQNNPLGIEASYYASIQRAIAEDDRNTRQMLDWGNGVFPLTDNAEDPLAERVLTPGYIIAQSVGQVISSGFRQLETANEIDQVVANLFGGLTTQLVADTRGLIGLTQSLNGQPSYLDRMTAQTSASVRQQATNAALAVIGAARQIELTYRQAKEGIATALTNAIQQLRSAEAQCWNLIIPAVQTYAQANGNPTLNIATSTQFSQQVVDSQIAPLATSTINNIRTSDAAIALLNQLIASVSGTASQAAQQQALLRLDTMVANRQLHTAADATNALTQRDNVVSAVSTLVTDTIKGWGDSTDPNVGWCNINNTAVIERWFNAWKQ